MAHGLTIPTLLTFLLTLLTFTTAKPTKYVTDFTFKAAHNKLDCPAAQGTKFTGPQGGEWGILCGWDTHSKTFHWGPVYDLTFEQCILECGSLDGCEVATYTGTCYLKQSAKGKGYVNVGGPVRAAVKLN